MANQTRQLAELLTAEGTHVELVQVNAPYRPAWIGRVRGLRAGVRLVPYLPRLWSAAGRVDLFHVMANSGWAWHLFAAPAVRVAALRGVPVVVNYRGGEAGAFLAHAAGSVRATLARAAALAVPSGYLQRVFHDHGIDGRVLPNIVDLERFRPAAGARRDPQAPHLVVARALEPIYDVGTALRAFAAVRAAFPRARLSIAGTGPALDALRSLARSLGIEGAVAFTGRLDREQMAALYREADALLNPTRVDNMPNSVLEALASGVPVVSTDVGGVPFVVARDDRAMAEATLALLRDGRLRAELTAAGLAEVQRYSWPRVRGVLATLYEDCLAGRSAIAPVT
jgi:glycosyltransferase involved in cell wall biosynthesis